MTMKIVKRQIEEMEQRLRFDRDNYVAKRIAYKKRVDKLRYLWFLLPISAFVVGFRRNVAIIATLVTLLKSQAFIALRHNIRSKLVWAVFRN